ncbi:hypothetical protein E2C01_061600 [Portunus trituberculatus]|uniref:Uncharacterized protein n=1 Tax=Portunus trituberculatus TaxID=210409 RepID=A0A5B7HCU5_PORTR|nr:hypothetical protein [Portunus trituberculatus]
MYQMALKGLLQNRLSLSEEDTERLEDSCKRRTCRPKKFWEPSTLCGCPSPTECVKNSSPCPTKD